MPVDRVLDIAAALVDAGAVEVGFGDTTGMANPVQVRSFFDAARARLPGVELTAHFHNTRGQGLANVLSALEAGVESFESSFGELAAAGACGRDREHRHRGPGIDAARDGHLDWNRLGRADRSLARGAAGTRTPAGEPRPARRARVVGGRELTGIEHGDPLEAAVARARAGGPERHREKAVEQGKLPVRERVARLLDAGSFAEEGLLAGWEEDGLGAEGVVTGVGTIAGRPVAVMANDPTVKAGSWAPKTVEKILRIQERALSLRFPLVYLVDSAGARINEQVQMFPGRAAPGGSSSTRCACRASYRRCASCSGRAPPAAPTSRRSATS